MRRPCELAALLAQSRGTGQGNGRVGGDIGEHQRREHGDTFIFFGLIGALTPAVAGTALVSKFAGVTVVWLIMAWRIRRRAVAN